MVISYSTKTEQCTHYGSLFVHLIIVCIEMDIKAIQCSCICVDFLTKQTNNERNYYFPNKSKHQGLWSQICLTITLHRAVCLACWTYDVYYPEMVIMLFHLTQWQYLLLNLSYCSCYHYVQVQYVTKVLVMGTRVVTIFSWYSRRRMLA